VKFVTAKLEQFLGQTDSVGGTRISFGLERRIFPPGRRPISTSIPPRIARSAAALVPLLVPRVRTGHCSHYIPIRGPWLGLMSGY